MYLLCMLVTWMLIVRAVFPMNLALTMRGNLPPRFWVGRIHWVRTESPAQ